MERQGWGIDDFSTHFNECFLNAVMGWCLGTGFYIVSGPAIPIANHACTNSHTRSNLARSSSLTHLHSVTHSLTHSLPHSLTPLPGGDPFACSAASMGA